MNTVVKLLFSLCAVSYVDLTLTGAEVILGVRDAKRLVETAPQIVRSENSGLCPEIERVGDPQGPVIFQVVLSCGKNPHTLGYFEVQLNTGTVRNKTTGVVIDSPEMDVMRKEIKEARISSRLSQGEAGCLLEHLPEVIESKSRGACPTSKLSDLDDNFEGWVQYSPDCRRDQVIDLGPQFIDRYQGIITDVESGIERDSETLLRLRLSLIRAHSRPELDASDAKQLVLEVPELVRAARAGFRISIHVDYSHSPAEGFRVFAYPADPKYQEPFPSQLNVDMHTGSITDPTGHTFESPDLTSLRRQVLDRAEERQRLAQADVQRACHQ